MKVILFFTDLDCQEQGININNWSSISIDQQRHIFINKETPPYDWNYLREKLSASGSESGLEFYIAFHGTTMTNCSQGIINDIQTNFRGSRISYKFYSHSDRDLIWSSFCNLMDFPNSASFDNLVKYIQIPWDLENFLELLHLLVNVPENATREEIEEKFLTPLINALSLNENEKEELRKKLSENLELMIAEDKKNILNKDYLQLYKEIYTMLNELVMKENE